MSGAGHLTVSTETTLREALRRLDEGGLGILLLVDSDGRLMRTITDGDIRRLILAGSEMSDKLSTLPAMTSMVAREGITPTTALELLNERQVDHLPVIDSAGRPLDVLLRRDLDTRILLSTPHLGEYEMEYIEEAFRTNWVAPLGPNVDAFESELSAKVGTAHAAAVVSGTAAIHLALRLLGVESGDTVFCSTLTFVASANPILYQGARPVFIDSEPESWNMSPVALERGLSDTAARGALPKAVIVVNLYGQSADMDPIRKLCAAYGVPIVEDAAESLGATYKGRASGTLGDVGIYSFNGNKIITTSGGGMLVSDNSELIEKARFLSTQARDSASWYEHSTIGYNYRMSNILAGIGRGQLRVLEDRVAARRMVYERYRENLAHIQAIRWMPEPEWSFSTRWLSVCMLDSKVSTTTPSDVIELLARNGIEARRVWKPMHKQPLFHGAAYYGHTPEWSFADVAFETGVCLPSGSNMSEVQQSRIVRLIESILT